jgi:hypothetical protein
MRTYQGRLRTRPHSIAAVAAGAAAALVVGVATPAAASPTPAPRSPDPTSASDAGAKKLVTFGVQPASALNGPVHADARPYLTYGVTPGAALQDHVAILNYSTKPLPLNVYATDGINTSEGGFSLLAAGQKPDDAGAWVSLGASSRHLVVPARSVDAKGRQVIGSVTLPIKIVVPRNASPGDHTGGIVASLDTLGANKNGAKVRLDQRVGTRVYVRVAGPLHPSLKVENLRVGYSGAINPFGTGSANVSYRVRNDGNVKLSARQAVKLSGLFGSTGSAAKPGDVPMLLPGSAIDVKVHLSSVLPSIRLSAKVSLTLLPVAGDLDPPMPRVSSSASTWAVPWTLLGLLVILAVAAGGWLWLRSRTPKLVTL